MSHLSLQSDGGLLKKSLMENYLLWEGCFINSSHFYLNSISTHMVWQQL